MKKFNITWTAPANDGGSAITGHDVGYTPSGGSETIVATGSTAAAYTLAGLTDDVEYSVRVRAENSAGKGAWSSAVVQTAAIGIPWSLANATYSQSLTMIAGADNLTEVVFKPDGTRIYTISDSSHNIDQYNLSTAWDISSATHAQSFYLLTEGGPASGMAFKPDGTRLFTSTRSGYVDDWELSTPWDISSLTHVRQLTLWRHLESQDPNIAVRPDGSAVYILGKQTDKVYEFTVTTPWDIATLNSSPTREFSIQAQEFSPTGLFFDPEGTKMFVCGESGQDVNEYDIASAWDITTAVYVQSFSVAAQGTSPAGLAFKDDGTEMYVADRLTKQINEYSL